MAILVIGGGQAAIAFVAKYRKLGGEKPITMVGEEAYLPYQRPPLSKKYLANEVASQRLYLRPETWYQEQQINLIRHCKVSAIIRHEQQIRLEDGSHIAYDKLLLATGARPRKLPQQAENLYYIRTIDDIDHMRGEFKQERRLCIIGGGYIGLEAASIARKLGLEVSLIEAAPRILGRVASDKTANFIRNMHQAHGVTIIEGVGVKGLEMDKQRICQINLDNGASLETDFIIAGIGIEANDELAKTADLQVDNGIVIDEYCRTNDGNIYAAGDCTRFDYKGQKIRLESVGNAIDQAEIVAANMAGTPTPYRAKPWFWSDQYDGSLQIAGLNMGYDHVVIRHHPPDEYRKWSVWYFKHDELLAVDSFNDAKSYMLAKRLLENKKTIAKSAIMDATNDLKSVITY